MFEMNRTVWMRAAALRHDTLVTVSDELAYARSGLIVMESNLIDLIDAGGS